MMVLGALATTSVFGQNRHKPVVPPTPEGVNYKSYLTSYMKEHSDFQDKMIFVLNSGLRNAQSTTKIVRTDLDGIISYTRFVDTTITDFQNSFRMDSARGPIWFYSQESYTGIVGVVNISGVLICWIKKDCGNILQCTPVRLQIAIIPKPEPAPVPVPVPTPAPAPAPKPEESEEEKRRQAYAQEVYLSQSQSQSFSHSRENFNQIKSSSVEGGGGLALKVKGGGYSNNYQSDGLLNTCGRIFSGRGDVSLEWQRPVYINNYENTSSSSSNTATASSSAMSLGQGENQTSGNGNNQNYQKPQGVPQPIYDEDPNSFVKPKKKALAVTAD